MASDGRIFLADSMGRLGTTTDDVLCWTGDADVEKAKNVWFDRADGRRLWIRGADAFEDATKPPPLLTSAYVRSIDGRPALVVPLDAPPGEADAWLRWYQHERKRRTKPRKPGPKSSIGPAELEMRRKYISAAGRVWRGSPARRVEAALKAMGWTLDSWHDPKTRERVHRALRSRAPSTAESFVNRVLAAQLGVSIPTLKRAAREHATRKRSSRRDTEL